MITASSYLLLAVAFAAAPAAELVDYSNFTANELGVTIAEVKKDEKTGFVVGGKNASSLIGELHEINGIAIAKLEADMRPDATSEVGSTAGFLGKDERLVDVLLEDNRYVTEELGLTHQELARHLRILAAIGERQSKEGQTGAAILYQGRRFTIALSLSRGYQLSPFRDGTKSNADVTVRNLDNGKQLSYSLLVPLMIERYGFYEGRETPYRVAPRQVIEVLDFLRPKAGTRKRE